MSAPAVRRQIQYCGPLNTYATNKHLKRLAWFVLLSKVGARLHVHALDEAIRSTEFMDWDAEKHTYRVGLIQRHLLGLRNTIESILEWEERVEGSTWADLRGTLFNALSDGRREDEQSVANLTMGPAFGLANLHANAVRLLCKLCIALDGDVGPLERIELRPATPFRDQVEGIEAATVTADDAARFVAEKGRV